MRGDLKVHLDRLVLVLNLLQLAKSYAAFCFFEATLVCHANIARHCGVIASRSDRIGIFRIRK
jgi:hypothetical protein